MLKGDDRMLKPPIPRLGGKSKLRKKIISKIPKHTCYIEPFFGAGWVFFAKEISRVEVINDVDDELINLFKMIKYHSDEVERLMKFEISSRQQFNIYRMYNTRELTEIQRAVRYMYIISQSFASRGGVYGYGTTTRPSPQIFEPKLENLKERLRNTYVENLCFSKVIEKYDRKESFVFCDPPYYGTQGYGVKFELDEHVRLRDMLDNIQGKFLLTINDCKETRAWYKKFNIEEVQVMYSVSRVDKARKNYKELIITNY